nr:putative signal peptide protein [Rhizobium sp. Q54]
MPRLANLYFKTAICFFLVGIVMGLQMSIAHNYAPSGAHAHTNLLGWVTMAIFGGYYALNPAKAETRLAMLQYAVYTAGVTVMVPSLYLVLTGSPALEPLVAISSILVFAGVLLFAGVVFSRPREMAFPASLPSA